MKRLLLASLVLALGASTATAQSNRVLNLEGTPFEVPSVDFSSNGVWLGATGVAGLPEYRGVKLWNLLTGDTYFIPNNDTEVGYSFLRFVPATNDLAILIPTEHLTVYRFFQLPQTEWRPLARFFVSAHRFDVAPYFAATALLDNVGRILLLRGLSLEALNGSGWSHWNTRLAFSPDGALLAIAGYRVYAGQNTVQLVRLSDLAIVRQFVVPFEIVGFDYAPNGRYIAVAGREGQLRLWDLQTNQSWDSTAVAHPVFSIRFSSDSSLLAVGENDGFVRLRRTPDLSPHSAIRTGYRPEQVAFHPTENTLYTTGSESAIDVWRVDTGQRERILARRWTPHGFRTSTREFWVSDMDTTYVFDAQGQLARQIPIGAGTRFNRELIAFSPDRQWVVLREGVRRVSDQQVVLNRLIANALFTRDSRRMVAQNGFVVGVYNTANWQLLWETNEGGFPAFSADGTRLLLYRAIYPSFARVVDTDTGQTIWAAPSNLQVQDAQMAPNGRLVAILYQGSTPNLRLRVYDVETNTIVLESPYSYVRQFAFSPNSRYLIASLGDGNFFVCHDLQTGQVLWEEDYSALPQIGVENFTPDSRYVVLKHSWGHPVIVEVATGYAVRLLSGRPYELITATYSDDGARLALEYADSTVEVVRHIPIEGDTNDDGCVDDADLLTVLFQFGQTSYGLSGDLNRDQRVDDADLLIVLFSFGSGC